MKKLSKKDYLSVIINLYLVISCVLVCVYGCLRHEVGGSGDYFKVTYFSYFTTLSNVFMALCALMVLVETICGKRSARGEMLYYAGASSVGLTFLIVVIFLSPIQLLHGGSYWDLFRRDGLFFHLINPLLSIGCFGFLLKESAVERKNRLFSLIPTVVYSFLYLFQVVVFQNWPDFYSFTFGGKFWLAPIDMVVMYLISYGVICAVGCLHNRVLKKKEE